MPSRDQPPTIDMTLQGDVVTPPSFFARARAVWRALPPGAVPAILTAAAIILIGLVFVGLIIVALPVLVILAALALLSRALARTR